MEKAKKALDTAKHLNDVMREIIRLDAYSSSMDTFKSLNQQIEELKNIVSRLRNMSPLYEDFVKQGGK